jgi:hypothetical protein
MLRPHCRDADPVRIASSLRADLIFGRDIPCTAGFSTHSRAEGDPAEGAPRCTRTLWALPRQVTVAVERIDGGKPRARGGPGTMPFGAPHVSGPSRRRGRCERIDGGQAARARWPWDDAVRGAPCFGALPTEGVAASASRGTSRAREVALGRCRSGRPMFRGPPDGGGRCERIDGGKPRARWTWDDAVRGPSDERGRE